MQTSFPRFGLLALGLLVSVGPAQAQSYAVVVQADNPATNVTEEVLAQMFKAETRRWENREKIYLVLPKSNLPEFAFLLTHVYGMSQAELSKHWVTLIYQNKISKRPAQLASTPLILLVVKKKKGSIAIINVEDLPETHGLKVLAVNSKHVGDPGYPLVAKRKKNTREEEPHQPAVDDTATALQASFGQEAVLEGADEPPTPPDRDPTEERLAALEADFADLRLGLLADELGEDAFESGPSLTLKGFSHINLTSTDSDALGKDSAFLLGGLDLFITSQLSENLSFLNETVFEPTEDGDNVLDVERLILKYEFSNALNLQAGRFHSTIGYWNETFHHGEWLQTSVGRPAILGFEDEGGLLPVHAIGLVAKGALEAQVGGIDYSIEISNGRGATPDPPQIAKDENNQKAINLGFSLRPAGIAGLKFGASYYMDRIPANTDAAAGPLHGKLDEDVYSVFVAFARSHWELLAEYFAIQHDGTTGTAKSDGHYVQVSRRFDEWTPYVRYQGLNVANADTFFSSTDNLDEIALGLRFDFDAWAALKFQYSRGEVTVPGGPDDTLEAFVIQLAFAF